MRSVRSEYQDPLDIVWLATCGRWGWKVSRSDQVFAAWDGECTLTIGTQETLDPDDSLAQLILHEFCHAMVEGPESWLKPDWGLDITDRSQLFHEHACLILQAALSDPFGLRTFFGSTTDARRFYDQLPNSPSALAGRLSDAGDLNDDPENIFAMAAEGLQMAKAERFWGPLQDALSTTAEFARLIQPFTDARSLWKTVGPTSASCASIASASEVAS